MRPVSLGVVLVLALASWAGAAETWIEVKSPNFTLLSNAGEGRARDMAWEFEQARGAFAKLWPWAKLAEGKTAVVLVARDESTLKRWAPRYWEIKGGIRPASLSTAGPEREYLLIRTDAQVTDSILVTPYFTVYRAYVSRLLSSSLDRALPVWLAIGLGEVYGNTSVRNKEVQVGRPVPWHLRQLHDRPLRSVRALMAAEGDSAVVRKDAERDVFDAQCWALVHFLSFADEGVHAPKLSRFIQLWLAGKPQEQAWAEAIGDMATIEQKLAGYSSRVSLSFGRLMVELGLERQRFPTRTVSPGEIATVRAAVHVALDRPVEAQDAIEEARAADAAGPASYDVEGLLADDQHDKTRAARAYAQAVDRGSTSAYTFYRAAQLAWKPVADAEGLATIRKRLERAVELNEKYAPAHSYLAEVMVLLDQAEAALPSAQRAVALDSGSTYGRIALARVLHKLGQDDAARASAQRGLQLATDEADKSNAEGFLTYLDRETQFQRQRAASEESQARFTACRNGEGAACAQLVPELERGCGNGHANACDFAAWLFAEGRGVTKDPARAASFVERACGAGDKPACVRQAWSQARGEGVAKDEPRGAAALEALCADKFFAACTRLALLHAGKAGAKDRARARELLTQACAGGEDEACALAKTMPR